MDLSFLTQEQQWGIAYEVQIMNQQIALQQLVLSQQPTFQPLNPQ